MTSMHGLARIAKSESLFIRIIWTLFTLISLIGGIIVITNSINSYYEYDYVTKTETVPVESIELPTVLFCHSRNDDVVILNSTIQSNSNVYKIDYYKFDYNFGLIVTCFLFNNYFYNKNNQSNKLHATLDRFILKIKSSENNSLSNNYLGFSDNYQKSALKFEFFFLNPRLSYNQILFTKSIETKLPEPYNQCNDSDKTYRQQNCISECSEYEIMNKYNCSVSLLLQKEIKRICSYNESDIYQSEFRSNCRSKCPKECETISYQSKVDSFDEFKLNGYYYSYLFFKYLDISYTHTTQSPKITGSSLISSIGGALGLFIGIRFLSFIEIFEFIFEISSAFYQNRT